MEILFQEDIKSLLRIHKIKYDNSTNVTIYEKYINYLDTITQKISPSKEENTVITNRILTTMGFNTNIQDVLVEFMNGIDLNPTPGITPTTQEKLKKYFTDLDLIGRRNYFNNHPYYFTILWTLIFASDYTSFVSRPLMGNSANCMFFKTTCTNIKSKEKEDLFVKVVDYPIKDTDNIIVDNINGYIINKIKTGFEDHFMEYVDSFTSFKKKDGNLSYWRLDELIDIRDNMSPFSFVQNNDIQIQFPNIELAHISVFKAINGESLKDICKRFASLPVIADEKCINIIHNLNDFMYCLEYFGFFYGMIHNDLHMGNIFYDFNTETFRMIDMGRVYIDNHTISEDEIGSFIKREVLRNASYVNIEKGYQNYKQFMSVPYIHRQNKTQKKEDVQDYLSMGFFADLVTMAGNFYYFYYTSKMTNHQEINNIISSYLIQIDNFNNTERKKWLFTFKKNGDINSLLEGYNICKTKINKLVNTNEVLKRFWAFVLDGLFCLCLTNLGVTQEQMNFNQLDVYYHFQVNARGYFFIMNDLNNLFKTTGINVFNTDTIDGPLSRFYEYYKSMPKKREIHEEIDGGTLRKIKTKLTRKMKGGTVEEIKNKYIAYLSKTKQSIFNDIDNDDDYFTKSYHNVLVNKDELSPHVKWAYDMNDIQGDDGDYNSDDSNDDNNDNGGKTFDDIIYSIKQKQQNDISVKWNDNVRQIKKQNKKLIVERKYNIPMIKSNHTTLTQNKYMNRLLSAPSKVSETELSVIGERKSLQPRSPSNSLRRDIPLRPSSVIQTSRPSTLRPSTLRPSTLRPSNPIPNKGPFRGGHKDSENK